MKTLNPLIFRRGKNKNKQEVIKKSTEPHRQTDGVARRGSVGGGGPVRHLPDPTLQLESVCLSVAPFDKGRCDFAEPRVPLRDLFRSSAEPSVVLVLD